MASTTLAVEYLFTIRFDTRPPVVAPSCPTGTRVLINVTGGAFVGPKLKGTVDAASDWVTMRAGGAMALDVRAQLTTDDGVTVLMSYGGHGGPDGNGEMVIRTTPRFEAPLDGLYAWLNDVVAVGVGSLGTGSVTYKVYALA